MVRPAHSSITLDLEEGKHDVGTAMEQKQLRVWSATVLIFRRSALLYV